MDDLIRSLPKLLRAAGESDEVLEAAAMVAWRRVAGEGLRSHAVPFRLHRKTFTVAVADRTWARQLETMSGQMLFQINSLLGAPVVTFIEFRVDPVTVAKERAKQPPAPDTEAQERDALAHSQTLARAANAIRDEDLRRRFLLAAGSSMAANKRNNS